MMEWSSIGIGNHSPVLAGDVVEDEVGVDGVQHGPRPAPSLYIWYVYVTVHAWVDDADDVSGTRAGHTPKYSSVYIWYVYALVLHRLMFLSTALRIVWLCTTETLTCPPRG